MNFSRGGNIETLTMLCLLVISCKFKKHEFYCIRFFEIRICRTTDDLKFLKAMIVKKSDYFMRYNLLLNKRMYISAFHLWTDQIIQL